MPLDLDFTEEQDMLREAVRNLCEDKASLESVRALETDEQGYSNEFWEQLCGLGVTGALVPEEHGGTGMSLLDTVVVYEEFGRSLAPSPHFVSGVVAAGVIARAGNDEQKAAWLPRLASGDAIVSAAWLEPNNSSGPSGVQLQATKTGDGFSLTGAKRHAFFAGSAEALIVPARTDDGVDLFIVPTNSSGLTQTKQESIASDSQYRIDLDGVTVPESARLGDPGTGWSHWHATLMDGVILLGALAVGAAEAVHLITVEYSKERHQFDKPLAAFQSLNHMMADGRTEIDGARVLVHQAAWARDTSRPIEKLAPMAKMFATEVARKVSADAIQIHGGMGFTVECDAQLYFRRAKSLEINWFDTDHLEELIAKQVLDTV